MSAKSYHKICLENSNQLKGGPYHASIISYHFQVCVDLFITTQTYVDIASLSVVTRTTGGQVSY